MRSSGAGSRGTGGGGAPPPPPAGWARGGGPHRFMSARRSQQPAYATAGAPFVARFDGPARAMRCACAMRDAIAELGLELRAGVHTGECELLDGKVAGIAVSIGARVSARAESGEVLVSQTVRDLVAGSGLTFEDRGIAELKGVPGEWRLYAVAASDDG